ncbi:MAG TPA: hypothetical protein VE978_16360 [Chitinophagales bacterium]|nr:hypothetical protein [Chitinophagales bacterium]
MAKTHPSVKSESLSKEQVISNATEWYGRERPLYRKLCEKILSILNEILDQEKINFHTATCRAKDVNSYSEKIKDSKYDDPINQIHDLAGIRIIAYVDDDVVRVCRIIKRVFEIDPLNSIDKSDELGIDKVGYRSVHFVAQLKADRLKLPEYKKFSGKKFEIQVRTILQHAWAEIEHDRNYKFAGELPPEIERKFKLLAGNLELADQEFNSLAKDIDKISRSVDKATKEGRLDIPINSTTLRQYLSTKFASSLGEFIDPTFHGKDNMIVNELKDFGVTTLEELQKLIPRDFEEKVINVPSEKLLSFLGILRIIMMVSDYKKYFEESWKKHWNSISQRLRSILTEYNLPIEKIEKTYNLVS